MAQIEHIIASDKIQRGTTQSITELHITGGIRAVERPGRLWSWHPVLVDKSIPQLAPLSINRVAQLANDVGLEVFGGDQQSGLETPLISRVWTPLNGPHDGSLQPADTWRAIARNADKAGDTEYATLAHHISFSLTAAGIRLRDASDGYHAQLIAAVIGKQDVGNPFANIPMYDLQLAFHSVLSELASTRDYLAASLASKLGAPAKVDAMNRFAEWVKAASRADLRIRPVVSEILSAYDETSANPWLHQLTEYRNLFLHRQPLGSSSARSHLIYNVLTKDGIGYPRIEMPLGDTDPSAPGQDALTRFIQLYRAMTDLVKLAAEHAPYSSEPETFVVR